MSKVDNICCSSCTVWHHLKCSGLSKTEFENHTKNKSVYWSCPDSVVYRCGKCAKVIGKKQECILFYEIAAIISHWIQLKSKGYFSIYKLLYLKVVVFPSFEPVTGRTANPKVD